MNQYLLRLFVSGETPTTRRALTNLQRVCANELHGRYQIEVIDVVENPELADQARVLATPTLIKQLPVPVRRVIGDLTNTEQVLMGLDLLHLNEPVDHGNDGPSPTAGGSGIISGQVGAPSEPRREPT